MGNKPSTHKGGVGEVHSRVARALRGPFFFAVCVASAVAQAWEDLLLRLEGPLPDAVQAFFHSEPNLDYRALDSLVPGDSTAPSLSGVALRHGDSAECGKKKDSEQDPRLGIPAECRAMLRPMLGRGCKHGDATFCCSRQGASSGCKLGAIQSSHREQRRVGRRV
jgi:hypothetical protein